MQVSDIMHRAVVTITPDESAALAARLLARHNIGLLPVCSHRGILQGVITDRDILLRCVAPEIAPQDQPVGGIMTRYPAAVGPADDIRQAAQVMAARQVRRLPVVEKGKVVGVLSLGDLARCGRYEMETSRALTEISENVRRL